MPYNAVITAGGRINGDFAAAANTSIKALIKIKERTLFAAVIEALRKSEVIDEIAVAAPIEIKDTPEMKDVDHFIPAEKDGVKNIEMVLKKYENHSRIIFCTSDLPFITESAVQDFVARCPREASICYPIYSKEEIPNRYRPGISSYIQLKDGEFTGGSIFMLNPSLCLSKIKEVGNSFNYRKSSIGLAKLLGWKVALKFILKICSLNDILNRACQIMGEPVTAVRGCHPSLTLDIDCMDSYNFALNLMKEGGIQPI